MTEPTDRAGLLLQRVRELLLESGAVAQQLENAPAGDEPSAHAAERIAYGIWLPRLRKGSSRPSTRRRS